MVTLAVSTEVGGFQVSQSTQNTATHGFVAPSRSGFVCMSWTHSSTNKNVSCTIGLIDPVSDTFQPVCGNIALALAGTSVYGGGESCEKAWCCALTDDTFVVTWERQATASTEGQIECARIYRSGGVWTAETASTGIGYVLDANVAPGDADANCRSTFVRNNIFFVSYSTETANSGTAPHLRAYTLRTGLFDWTTTGQAPSSLGTKQYPSQHWDDTDAAPTVSGGYLVSHSVVTARGDLFVAWEARTHSGGTYTSTLEFRLLAGPYAAVPLAEISTSSSLFTALTDSNLALRRPQFGGLNPTLYSAIATTSGANRVLMAYGQENISTPASSVAKLAWISLYAGAMSKADVTWTSNGGVDGTADAMSSAAAVVGLNLSAGLANANYDSNKSRYFSIQHSDGTTHEVTGRRFVMWPDRPFAMIWRWKDREYLVLYYEGSNTGVASAAQKYVECWRLA